MCPVMDEDGPKISDHCRLRSAKTLQQSWPLPEDRGATDTAPYTCRESCHSAALQASETPLRMVLPASIAPQQSHLCQPPLPKEIAERSFDSSVATIVPIKVSHRSRPEA